MSQTIDLLKNSSFEQGMADLVTAIQTQSNHSHANLAILNATTAPYTTEEKAEVSTIRNKPNTSELSEVAFSGDYHDLLNIPEEFTVPMASTTTLGGVKVGSGLSIDGNGILSASGAVSSVNGKTGAVTLSADDVNAYSKTEVDEALDQFYADPYIATSIEGETLSIRAQASESEVSTVIDSNYARLNAVEGSVVGIIYDTEEPPATTAVGVTWIDG